MRELKYRWKILSGAILVILAFFIIWALTPVDCPECNGSGTITVKCGACNGSGTITKICGACHGAGTIERELAYKVLDHYEEKVNAITGVWFKFHITIKNMDKRAGEFMVEVTVNVAGHIDKRTQTVWLSAQERRELIFPPDGWYQPGFSTYSISYDVDPQNVTEICSTCGGEGTLTVTCPTCRGKGTITKTCSKCGGTGKVSRYRLFLDF